MKSKMLRLDVRVTMVAGLLALGGTIHTAEAQSTNAPARGQAGGGRAPSLDSIFTTLDKNKDGRISKEEATGNYAQRFSQWDADGDGFATRQEIHDYRLRLGIGDDGLRIAGAAAGGTNAAPAAAGNAGNNPRAQGGQRRATATATILKEPDDWRLETMAIPPGFARDIKLTGAEEIRFAPGMFDNTSSNHFTCIIAITADGTPELGAVDLKDFLEKYYRGLSTGVGRGKGMSPDPAQMVADVTAADAGRFNGRVVFFDTFTDGRKITLNVEARTFPMLAKKQTCLLLLVSPSAKESAVWTTLREVGKKAAANLGDSK
ncbi:MAG: hypothetical protein HY301_04730 [Verrucomicrobia bacterium]|nr:hypothetical protein [Verrucomicrobiota bacterium]